MKIPKNIAEIMQQSGLTDIPTVANAIGVHSATISGWCRTKKIRAAKVNTLWYVDLDEARVYAETVLPTTMAQTAKAREVLAARRAGTIAPAPDVSATGLHAIVKAAVIEALREIGLVGCDP